jgi:peroxiredoxin
MMNKMVGNFFKTYGVMMLLSLTFYSCAQKTEERIGHEITIEVVGIKDSSTIVGYHFGNQRLILDSAEIINDKLQLKGEYTLEKGVYFLYSPNFYFEFIISNQFFEMKINSELGYKDIEISGSEDNELFAQFQNKMAEIQKQQSELSGRLTTASAADSISITQELEGIGLSAKEFRESLISDNPDLFFISFLKIVEGVTIPEFEEIEDLQARKIASFKYYRDHYFDVLDDAPSMMRTPVFHGYVMKYFDDLVIRQSDSVNIEIKDWLDKFEGHPQGFRYWLMTLYTKYQESKIMGMDGVTVFLSDEYFLTDKVDFMDEDQKLEIEEELKFIRPNLIGKMAPRMNLLDTAMQPFSLNQLNEKYLIYFFYDPDCGHCKKKTPVLKDAYADLKKAGAEVIAICTITDTDKWKKFIKEQKLDWLNLGDPLYQNNFRMEYNVRTTPQLYVLNQERKIIAKKIDVEQVLDFIQNYELLDQNLAQ